MNDEIKTRVRDFNPDHIFDCGQCFRWKKEEDGSWTGRAHGKNVNFGMEFDKGSDHEGILIAKGIEKAEFDSFWRNYLDLDRDYGKIKQELASRDAVIAEAIEKGRGIRILKQDLWETIVSFIISQNNNIPRIRGCIDKLIAIYEKDGEFPPPEYLASLEEKDLEPARLGYRAKYIIGSSKQVVEKGLPENEEQLLALTGVGPKVASCISLFGMGDLSSFPVDVWVKRVMNRLYGFDEKDIRGMKRFATETFGEYGGIAQQYLFYYIRQTGCEL